MSRPLSQYFTGIGAKRLSDVEINPARSNQHEFNGVGVFKGILGEERINFKGQFIFLNDVDSNLVSESGSLTWYDARENHPSRTEYRLYYSTNNVISKAVSGDLVVIGRTAPDHLAVFVAPQGSTSERQLLWLFGLTEVGSGLTIKDITENDTELGFAGERIISALGFEIKATAPDFLAEILEKFGTVFPSTIDFSAFARSTLSDLSPVEEPDTTLLAWLEREELLFRTLEKHIVTSRLQEGFGRNSDDVDGFISFSLSVQNRRKSRAGFAFENHLEFLFNQHDLRFSRGARTERNNKPDFLFPDITKYKDPEFSAELLTMLGVKTTAKDRWRQVLSEAERIRNKHLITLEPAISKNQTDEMIAQNLQLVLPMSLITTYTNEQQGDLISVYDFIQSVKDKQQRIYG